MKIFEVTKNRGNLRFLPPPNKNFLGVVGQYKGFSTFQSQELGDRALIKLLIGYISKGYNTIDKIVNRYAPSVENDTKKYVAFVVGFTGWNKDQRIEITKENLFLLWDAIIAKETGLNATHAQFEKAFALLDMSVKKKVLIVC